MTHLEHVGFEIGKLQGQIMFYEDMKTWQTDIREIERINRILDDLEARLYMLLGIKE